MECRSCLTNPSALLVVDASVVISLNATRYSGEILEAVPNSVVVVEEVGFELEQGHLRKGYGGRPSALDLARHVGVVRLGEVGKQHFGDLVLGHAEETLDDGEAATIGYALEHFGTVLIDERKANRICAERFPELARGCTVDLLGHRDVQRMLGRDKTSDAVFNALHYGRMQVPTQYVEWVVGMIGGERAARCRSLPKAARIGSLP